MGKCIICIYKFFLFNGIPFNAADNWPYYQYMINTITEVGPDIKGPMRYQIDNAYLEEYVTPRPKRVYGMCNRRIAYVHQGLH